MPPMLSHCNKTSCEICEEAFNDGTCISPPGAQLVANNGIVSCQPGSYLTDDACVPCDVFGEECQRCSPDGCLECRDAVVAPTGRALACASRLSTESASVLPTSTSTVRRALCATTTVSAATETSSVFVKRAFPSTQTRGDARRQTPMRWSFLPTGRFSDAPTASSCPMVLVKRVLVAQRASTRTPASPAERTRRSSGRPARSLRRR